MNKETYKPRILLVDDDEQYSRSLQNRAYTTFGLELIHYENWEEAFTELKANRNRYSALILDAKGKINSDDKAEDERHLLTARDEFLASGINLPYYVLTAFFDNYEKVLPENMIIFSKNKEEEGLLKKILEDIEQSDKINLARKYPSETRLLDSHFQDDQIKKFIELYSRDIEEYSEDETGSALGKLRVVNEATVDLLIKDILHYDDLEELITEIRDEKNPKANIGNRVIHFIDYYSDNMEEVPGWIKNNIKNIYYTASGAGSHSPIDDKYQPTNYQLISFLYGYLEVLRWVEYQVGKHR